MAMVSQKRDRIPAMANIMDWKGHLSQDVPRGTVAGKRCDASIDPPAKRRMSHAMSLGAVTNRRSIGGRV